MSLIAELKRRNVLRVAAGYIVAAWLVVQLVETIFPAFGFGDEAVRFVVIGFAVGFIPVVVAAWVLEWTPEGIRKDEDVERHGPAVAAAAKRWDRIVMVILAAAVAFFIVENILERPIDVEPTIAVLPFTGIGSDAELEYLLAGVAEGIHTSLARIPELVVSAWPTVVKLRSEGLDAVEIAAKLEAPNFLDGTVQKAGDSVRITARLVAGDSGRTTWSETYDGAMADIFAIQDEIAAAAVANLQVGRSAALPRTQRTNPETYRLTLQAWSTLNRVNQENVGSIAAALLEEALALDPNYLSALNALSFAAYIQVREGAIAQEEAEPIYRDVQERVLAIDPENGVANTYLAWDLLWDAKEFAHANHHLQVALRTGLNDGEVLRNLAGFARRTGNMDAALWFVERALAADPTCENCFWQLSENLFYAGRIKEAIEAKERFQALGSGGYYNHAVMLLMSGEPEAAIEVIAGTTDPKGVLAIQAMAYHALGDAGQFAQSLAELKQLESEQLQISLAEVHAFTGDKDLAFEALENTAARGGRLQYHLFLPQWANLRDDPRWSELRERLDMADEKLSLLDFSPVLQYAQ